MRRLLGTDGSRQRRAPTIAVLTALTLLTSFAAPPTTSASLPARCKRWIGRRDRNQVLMKIRKRAVVTIAIASVLAGCGEKEREQPARQQSAQAPRLPATQSGRIVFSADGDIVAINPDGSGRVRLTSTDDEIESNPAWSPDGRRVAFVRGDGSVYVMNADGSAIKRVTEPRPEVEAPAWSPDGRRLAFGAAAGSAFAIYVVNVDGTGLRRVFQVKTGWVGDPDWSPDAKRLAVARDPTEHGGETDIYVMSADGSAARRVTRTHGDEGAPDWSRDGKRILFGAGGRGIFTIRPSGKGQKRIAEDPLAADTLSATWSPDERRIAFSAKFKGGGGSEIYVMNADGSDVKPITDRLPAETQLGW